ncbi:histidine kinase [Microbacterium sp. LRZ72]|uniref:histidine kinase n=1 Tax=Microbacterium sp. LRZ72 TaxID=2942481 RepID=UPI0029BEFAEE|nr:histidine kinase [Microbacterium sp. LRZ72]MDX2377071.1 histidine kinase [Microbacterium sp. LRZ72]
MSRDPYALTAAALVALEGIGLAAVSLWMTAAFLGGDIADPASGTALALMGGLATVATLAFAVAIVRERTWGRSGAFVLQLLILAVAGGAVTGAYALPMTALALAVPAVVTAVLIVIAARRSAAAGDARSAADEGD